jgi:hypothetical protein
MRMTVRNGITGPALLALALAWAPASGGAAPLVHAGAQSFVAIDAAAEPAHHKPKHRMKSRGRGLHLGWTRGKHKGWRKF